MNGSCLCGAVSWTLDGLPDSVTVCNCEACRRYGALWAYGWVGETLVLSGEVNAYVRPIEGPVLSFNFCAKCGSLAWWQGLKSHGTETIRAAVNIRLAHDLDQISSLPIRHFDGSGTFEALPADGRTVADYLI